MPAYIDSMFIRVSLAYYPYNRCCHYHIKPIPSPHFANPLEVVIMFSSLNKIYLNCSSRPQPAIATLGSQHLKGPLAQYDFFKAYHLRIVVCVVIAITVLNPVIGFSMHQHEAPTVVKLHMSKPVRYSNLILFIIAF